MKGFGETDLKQGNKGNFREKIIVKIQKKNHINVKLMELVRGVACTGHRKDPFIQMTYEL